jgi:hypothetical protein
MLNGDTFKQEGSNASNEHERDKSSKYITKSQFDSELVNGLCISQIFSQQPSNISAVS